MSDTLTVPAQSGRYDWSHSFRLPNVGRGVVAFTAQATSDVHVAISPLLASANPMYEIVIGGWGNTRSVIRRAGQGEEVASAPVGLTSPGGQNALWVAVDSVYGTILVGRGAPGQGIFLSYTDPRYISTVAHVNFSSWDRPITYSGISITEASWAYVPPSRGAYNWKRVWSLPEAGNGALMFTAEARNDVHVAITAGAGPENPMYEIVIGGWDNARSVIRRTAQGTPVASANVGLGTRGARNPLWVALDKSTGSIAVGSGASGNTAFLTYRDPAFLSAAQCVTFSSWDSPILYSDIRGQRAYALQDWGHNTALPDGTRVAIRLRVAMTNLQTGYDKPWVRWFGLGPDGVTLDAVDSLLSERNIFTVRTFVPTGATSLNFGLPWYCLQASNGNYVVGTQDGTGRILANQPSLDGAYIFGRGHYPGETDVFYIHTETWGNRQTFYERSVATGRYQAFPVCGYAGGNERISQWVSGPPPNYGAWASGHVDHFIVT